MSSVPIQKYASPCQVENENTLITDYWLEFVAAHDETEHAAVHFKSKSALQVKVQEFHQRIRVLLDNRDKLRGALQRGLRRDRSNARTLLRLRSSRLRHPYRLTKRRNRLDRHPEYACDVKEPQGIFTRVKLLLLERLHNSSFFGLLEKLT